MKGTISHIGDNTDIQPLVNEWIHGKHLHAMDGGECFATGVHAGVALACEKLDAILMTFVTAKLDEWQSKRDASSSVVLSTELGYTTALNDVYTHLMNGAGE